MPSYDAASQNEKRSSRVYKDLNLNFTRNPVTGDVATVTDVNAVKRSIRNLLLTNHYEMILNFEPRARVESVECFPVPDSNRYDVRIYFYVENLPTELIEFQTILESVR